MEVAGMNIDRDAARQKVEQFTAGRRKHLTEMDRALYAGYKAMAEGLTVIDVNHAIKAGGHFEDTYCPKLAIARADLELIWWDHQFRYNDGDRPLHGGSFNAWPWNVNAASQTEIQKQFYAESNAVAKSIMEYAEEVGYRIQLQDAIDSLESERMTRKRWYRANYTTTVPAVPFHLRPKDLENYFILWEVAKWEQYPQPTAPGDPLLLKRIAHPVYVVVAQWDLTELEQRILESFRKA